MRKNFVLGVRKKWKADGTPLTKADLQVNRLVVSAVRKRFPSHSVLAEEGSSLRPSEFVWVCDPIDGTTPFSHGYPTFIFSLALTRNGKSIFGVLYDPIANRLAVAEKGRGTLINGRRSHVRRERTINDRSFINLDGDSRLIGVRAHLLEKKNCWVSTLYSCAYASLLVAAGEFTAEVFEYKNPWDGAAAKIIVEEAGGRVTDILGKEQRYDRPLNGFIASNGSVHGELVKVVRSVLREHE